MNPISIETLEVLDAIDRRGSFAKASEELNKATSALSYAIQKLEEQLGVTVFERQGRRSVLTPAGVLLLVEGRKILQTTNLLADRAKEVASGWEPRLRVAVESTFNYTLFFKTLGEFLRGHENIEVDVCESVLSGSWEALEQNSVDLLVGATGPVPVQKGIRAVIVHQSDLVPVIAAHHPQAYLAEDSEALQMALPNIRRVVMHDTSRVNVRQNAGLSDGRHVLYVQTMDQKIEAQLAGLGVGYLPRHRIVGHLQQGRLLPLNLQSKSSEIYIAWRISNKGKALKALSSALLRACELGISDFEVGAGGNTG